MLAKQLIKRPSVTPSDAGCCRLIVEKLAPVGFEAENFDCGEVSNLWLRRGKTGPLLVFAGHVDVVPPGDEAAWQYLPFTPTEADGLLYGRGSADMKGSVAAMAVACRRFAGEQPSHRGSIALLLTSDEEGVAQDGTRYAIEQLMQRGEKIDWCVIGEPSSEGTLGDTIKIGRRGSLTGHLTLRGKQGHVAYPQHALNPIQAFAPILNSLYTTIWDKGNRDFPPTSFQLSNIHAGIDADNVIPGTLEANFNFRFSTENTEESLRGRVTGLLDSSGVDYSIDWHLSGQPFLTDRDSRLVKTVRETTLKVAGIEPRCSTAGGTSDGRFIAATGADIVEIGPVNASIHQVDEHVKIEDLETLTRIYHELMQSLLV